MKTIPLAFALAILTGSAVAHADTALPYGNIAPGTLVTDCTRQSGPGGWCPEAGVGDDGAVTCDGDGTSVIFHSNGQLDCWFYTGYNPGTSGYFEVPTNQVLQPSPSTNTKHCIGFVSLSLTAPQYAATYSVADWPFGMQIWQEQESASGSNQNAFEHFGWASTWGTNLAPYSTYAYHVYCPIQ
jgi:hypothetical protein